MDLSVQSFFRSSVTVSLMGPLDLTAISPLFVDRFGRTLRFCYLEFDKEAISDGCRSEDSGFSEEF